MHRVADAPPARRLRVQCGVAGDRLLDPDPKVTGQRGGAVITRVRGGDEQGRPSGESWFTASPATGRSSRLEYLRGRVGRCLRVG